jgi:fibro-slime domain-containing protein
VTFAWTLTACAIAAAGLAAACGNRGAGWSDGNQNTRDGGVGVGVNAGDDGSAGPILLGGQGDGAPPQPTPLTLPSNLVKTEFGGYALGPPLLDAGMDTPGDGGAQSCSLVTGVVRDVKGATQPGGHPDFEVPTWQGSTPTLGLVAPNLGADRKPVYASLCEASLVGGRAACPYGQMTTSKASFDEWYRYTPSVNLPYILYLQLVPNGMVFTFESLFFFPVDNAGWGDPPLRANDGKLHNFSFTTEIHTEFRYLGGETFIFNGDDDVWVFMNGKLAIDLGGLHPMANGTIVLDQSAGALGLTKGATYRLEIFHAERHTDASTFRIDTNLAFTNCGTIPPDVPR